MTVRVLVVCSGNICRSPTAEAVLRAMIVEAGLDSQIEVDSAGMGDWHVGQPADERSRAVARGRGYRLDGVARQVSSADFERFDVIAAVDEHNLEALQAVAPPAAAGRLRRLGADDVPDPYYGEPDGFEAVFDLIEQYSAALLDELRDGLRQG